MQPRISPVILNIIILNALVWVFINLNIEQMNPIAGDDIGWSQYVMLYKSGIGTEIFTPKEYPIWERYFDHFQPVQLVSSMFAHVDLMHIFFNMFTLFSLGTAVEMVVGSKRFALLYLFSGLFGTIVTWLLDPSIQPVLGASGALFGVFGAFAFYMPNVRLSLFFIPIGIKAKHLVMGAAGISLGILILNLAFNTKILDGISHFGHMAGLAGGMLFIYGGQILGIFNSRRR